MTKEELDNILTNSDFSECISDAAPFRVKIIQEISPRMKEIKKAFNDLLVKVDYLNVSAINAKLKIDKKDDIANGELKEWEKKTMNLFRSTLKSIHPNENQVPSVSMIYVAGKLLNYIGRNDIVDKILEDKNIDVKFSRLEDVNKNFDNDNVRAQMIDIFKQADECQGDMCKNSDMIKKDIFERLPSEVVYDGKNNKKGLKPGDFQKLVRSKAMGIIKDSDKYTKYIAAQINGTNANIDREEVILGKTKQM